MKYTAKTDCYISGRYCKKGESVEFADEDIKHMDKKYLASLLEAEKHEDKQEE